MTTTLIPALIMAADQAQGGGLSSILMIVAMIVIFYFFMIRPQSKKQKEIKKAREAMTKGDKVVTAGGIYGKIRNINDADNTLSIEIAQEVVIKVGRDSVYPAGTETPKGEEKK